MLQIHFFGDLIRGIGLYSNGLIDRAQSLFNSYLLSNISFNKNSIVIDCGANYADLWLSLRERINKHCYITFEPGFVEFQAIKKNAPDGKHSNIGLSNKEGKSKFYVNQKDGDSSLIEPSSFTKIVEVKTTTLNKYFKEHKIKKIKLLKLEAEGFEPEILQGANRVLKKIEYVAVDGSHERGKKNEETFSNVCNILFSSNFKIVSINFYRQRALFVQKQNKK